MENTERDPRKYPNRTITVDDELWLAFRIATMRRRQKVSEVLRQMIAGYVASVKESESSEPQADHDQPEQCHYCYPQEKSKG